MTNLLIEQPIENRKSKIDNPQYDRAIIALLSQPSIAEAARACGLGESTLRRWLHQPDFAHAYAQARQQAFSVALGYLQNLSEQAVQTLQSLMQDQQVSPTVRLSAARTVLQMSFKGAELLTLQTRLDQLETDLATLDADPPTQQPQHHPQPRPQSKIENRKSKITPVPLKSSHPAPTSSHPCPDSEQGEEESNTGNGSKQGSVQNTRCWWRPGKIRHTVSRKRSEAPKHSNPLSSAHPATSNSPPLEEGSLRGRDSYERAG